MCFTAPCVCKIMHTSAIRNEERHISRIGEDTLIRFLRLKVYRALVIEIFSTFRYALLEERFLIPFSDNDNKIKRRDTKHSCR